MAHCSEIAPLLSAFSDGELSPLETEQVSHHLGNCEGCRETLLDFVLLGHHLRAAVAMPPLEGFAGAVMEGIAASRTPLRERLLYWLEELRARWIAVVSLAGAAIATASLFLVLTAPQAVNRVSSLVRGASRPIEQMAVEQAQNTPAAPVAEPAVAASNSETFISRLESRHPDVATWSEPDNKTTVIWLGDDASGNE